MTGLIVTDTNFKRFAKNLKKLKPELSVVSAQEELAKTFGFKNLFNFKQSISKKEFSISNENFKSLSCRLNVDLESSKVDDTFAGILGYKNYETFYLTAWADDFVNGLMSSFPKEATVVDKCLFSRGNNAMMLNFQGKKNTRNNISFYFSNTLVDENDKVYLENIERKSIFDNLDDQLFKDEVEPHINKFLTKEKDFITKVTPFLRKKVFKNGLQGAKLICLNRDNTIKIDDNYYETSYYLIPNSKLASFQSNEQKVEGYSLAKKINSLSRSHTYPTLEKAKEKIAFFPRSYTYYTLEKAKEKLMSYSNIKNSEISEICIVELREQLFTDKENISVLRYFLLCNSTLVEKDIKEEVLY